MSYQRHEGLHAARSSTTVLPKESQEISGRTAPSIDPNSTLRLPLRWMTPCLLAGLVFTGFTATVSALLALYFSVTNHVQEPGLVISFVYKAAGAGVVMLVLGALLYCGRPDDRRPEDRRPDTEAKANSLSFSPMFLAVLLGIALLVYPRLNAYPWAAPDEMHHLVVARNIAEYGAYASGHPDSELRYFDHYDSVGAPVLLPIAAAFALVGSRYDVARGVVATSYLFLALFVFAFLRRDHGATAAAISVVALTFAFSSLYLARTLYGEVPAFAFFLAGILAWRASIDNPHRLFLALGAGCLLGFATLSKTFLLLSAFAFAVTILHDRMTTRRIGITTITLTGFGVVGMQLVWWACQLPYRDVVAQDAPPFVYYRHYLMFGVGGVENAALWMAKNPAWVLLCVVGYTAGFRYVANRRYDPAALTLLLTGLLFGFWWVFFTPAQIPRYLWYTSAVAAIFAGPAIIEIVGAMRSASVPAARRLAYGALLIALVAPLTWNGIQEFRGIAFSDPMFPERTIAASLESTPSEARIGTTFWPMERSMNFMANRIVSITKWDDIAECAVVITRASAEDLPPGYLKNAQIIEPYAIVSGDSL